MDTFRDRIKELRRVPAAELLSNPRQWRRHPKSQAAALRGLLAEVGYADALLVRETPEGLVLIDGHLRASVTPEMSVPVLVLDVDEQEADKILLTHDPLTEMAGASKNALAELLASVETTDDGVAALLEDLALRNRLDLRRLEGLTNADDAPGLSDEPVARPGEIWQLGDHRLMCGDSTNPVDVERLMNGEKASLLATDPPYLVDYDSSEHGSTLDLANTWDDYHGVDASIAFFRSFFAATLPHLVPDAAIYQWHATMRQHLVMRAWEESGLRLHQSIIWVKPRAVLTRSHYMWMHEPCFYGWVQGQQPAKKPPAYATTVWEIAGESDGIHPTQKPVEIFERPIAYHTNQGDIVLEPFSGSGSQIIAAERLNRRCFAMEQEPRYVDVAVSRWQQFTGRTAIKKEQP